MIEFAFRVVEAFVCLYSDYFVLFLSWIDGYFGYLQLQGEAEKAKKEKKREKKREKKEKKARENGEIEEKKQHHNKGNKDERQQDEKDVEHVKKRERSAEFLDWSTLTEEHPVGSQNSSDSTLNSNNSNKRQKQNLSPECRQNTGECVYVSSLAGRKLFACCVC